MLKTLDELVAGGLLRDLAVLMRRSDASMSASLEPSLKQVGFTFTQFLALALIRDGSNVSASDICNGLSYDSGAMTRVIDQLVKMKLVHRFRDNSDRRKVTLQLSGMGTRVLQELTLIVVDNQNAALVEFSAAEICRLSHLLAKLNSSSKARAIRGN